MKALHQLLKDSTGLDLPEAAVERALRERMQTWRMHSRADYAPSPGSPEFEALVDLVVVPESWLFRDPPVFGAALRFVQRRLLARPGAQVRILSLPCAGGEEPYSMAMSLAQAGIPSARCRIDAVDLSQAAIARARQGRYTRNAFRGADLGFRERWFTQDGDAWLIDPALHGYVSFRQGSLFAQEAGPEGGYDLVFCRNLLIYFDADGQRRAAELVQALLAADGLLLSGYAEVPAFCRHGFVPAPQNGVFALHRQDAPAQAPRTRTWAPASTALAASRSVDVQPDPLDLLARARRHADAGALSAAIAVCRDLLAMRPEHVEAWFLLGLVHECGGNASEAARCWRRCLYLQPDHYEALCSLALLLELQGETVFAAGLRQRAGRIFQRRARPQA